jgi:hypothetical protein
MPGYIFLTLTVTASGKRSVGSSIFEAHSESIDIIKQPR